MGGSSSKKQTVGYKYHLGVHLVLCHGPVDEIQAIRVEDNEVWTGSAQGNTTIPIRRRNLFGGDKRGGGISGDVDVLMGGEEQSKNSYLVGQLGSLIPAFRGVVSLVLKRMYIGTQPSMRRWAVLTRRIDHSTLDELQGTQWLPQLAEVGDGDMNPAHTIREMLCSYHYGLGYNPHFDIDAATFEAAAQQFHDEGMGLSLMLNEQFQTEDFIRHVLNHIDAAVFQDPVHGRWVLKPIRDDYDVAEVTVVDESNISELVQFRRPGWGEMPNQVTVAYDDRASAKERTVTVQNMALVQMQGAIVARTIDYHGFSNADAAMKAASRELRQLSTPLAQATFYVLPDTGLALRPGDVVNFNWGPLGISQMPLRVTRVHYGTLPEGQIRVEGVEDIFGILDAVYAPPPPTGWQPTQSEPVPVDRWHVLEVPYWSLVTQLFNAQDAADDAIAEGQGWITVIAEQPIGDARDFELRASLEGGDWQPYGTGDFATGTLLAASPGQAQFSTVEAADTFGLEDVAPGELAMLTSSAGRELVGMTSADEETGQLEIARGVLDTPPLPHDGDTRLWFLEHGSGWIDERYEDEDTVDVRALPTTSRGTLDLESAPSEQVTLARRALRPYAPGNLRINGDAYPTFFTGGLALTWAHRNRLQQTVDLVHQDEGDIGPEDGTTYRLEIREEAGAVIVDESALSNTDYDLTIENEKTVTGLDRPQGRLEIFIEAEISGLVSWRKHTRLQDRAGFGLNFGRYFGAGG